MRKRINKYYPGGISSLREALSPVSREVQLLEDAYTIYLGNNRFDRSLVSEAFYKQVYRKYRGGWGQFCTDLSDKVQLKQQFSDANGIKIQEELSDEYISQRIQIMRRSGPKPKWTDEIVESKGRELMETYGKVTLRLMTRSMKKYLYSKYPGGLAKFYENIGAISPNETIPEVDKISSAEKIFNDAVEIYQKNNKFDRTVVSPNLIRRIYRTYPGAWNQIRIDLANKFSELEELKLSIELKIAENASKPKPIRDTTILTEEQIVNEIAELLPMYGKIRIPMLPIELRSAIYKSKFKRVKTIMKELDIPIDVTSLEDLPETIDFSQLKHWTDDEILSEMFQYIKDNGRIYLSKPDLPGSLISAISKSKYKDIPTVIQEVENRDHARMQTIKIIKDKVTPKIETLAKHLDSDTIKWILDEVYFVALEIYKTIDNSLERWMIDYASELIAEEPNILLHA